MKISMKKFLKHYLEKIKARVNFPFDFEEAFTFFKFKNFDYILKFTFVDNFTEVVLPVTFTKAVPLRKLVDGNCL